MNNCMAIVVTEAKHVAERVEGLDARVRAAMECTRSHWLVTREAERFEAAIGGVLLATTDSDEKARLQAAIEQVKALSRVMDGNLVGVEDAAEPDPPLPLVKMWKELDEGRRAHAH